MDLILERHHCALETQWDINQPLWSFTSWGFSRVKLWKFLKILNNDIMHVYIVNLVCKHEMETCLQRT